MAEIHIIRKFLAKKDTLQCDTPFCLYNSTLFLFALDCIIYYILYNTKCGKAETRLD